MLKHCLSCLCILCSALFAECCRYVDGVCGPTDRTSPGILKTGIRGRKLMGHWCITSNPRKPSLKLRANRILNTETCSSFMHEMHTQWLPYLQCREFVIYLRVKQTKTRCLQQDYGATLSDWYMFTFGSCAYFPCDFGKSGSRWCTAKERQIRMEY